jgi:hypothetical protein
VCNQQIYSKKIGFHVLLKQNMNLMIFVHLEGDEFWLNGATDFPVNVESTRLDTGSGRGISSAILSLSETESTFLSKPEEPCKQYAEGLLKPLNQVLQPPKHQIQLGVQSRIFQ